MPGAFISELDPHVSTPLSETLARYGFRAQHVPLDFSREIIAAASEYISLVSEQRRLVAELQRTGAREKAAELWKKA
jgi:hypothetical protein